MNNRKFSLENINGIQVLKIKNHPIMSSGVWNDWFYDDYELSEAFKRTDWDNEKTRYLYFDHQDTLAKNFIGKVENPRLDENSIIGDLLISNSEAQKALLLGAKFGISPKILGKGSNGSVKNFSIENWSLVVEPACQTTFLNSSKVQKGVDLIPNTFFILRQNIGDIMNTEKLDEQPSETPETTPEEPKEEPKPEPKPEEPKAEEPKTEETKEALQPKVEVVSSKSKRDYDAEENRIKHAEMIKKFEENGMLSSDYSSFANSFLKAHPDASFKEVLKAWNLMQNEKNIEKIVEQKLAAREKGNKVSMNPEATPPTKVNATGYEDVDVGMLEYLQGGGLSSPIVLELSMQPKTNPLGLRNFELSATATTTSTVRGTQFSAATYPLQPIQFLRKAIDAAKERMRFAQVATQYTIPTGNNEIVVPYRTTYLDDSSWESSTAEFAAGSEIDWTDPDTADGKKITPTRLNYGIAISNHAIRTSALNQIQYMREELAYKHENSIDSNIRDAVLGTATSGTATEPTAMTNTVRGAQTIFGGDATNANSSLDSGDILTTEMFKKARRLLMSTRGYYWNSNTWTLSGTAKNAWEPTPGEPFVFFMAPEQEEALQNETQFTNAAEYGSNEVVLNGEIGKYLDVKVVSTTKVPGFDATTNTYIDVAGSNVTMDVTGHLCGMVKAGVCSAQVFGLKPQITVFDFPSTDQVRMKLSMAYASSAIHADAIARMVVSDE